MCTPGVRLGFKVRGTGGASYCWHFGSTFGHQVVRPGAAKLHPGSFNMLQEFGESWMRPVGLL